MPKLKAPLFSIHARGTIANSLTYRHRKHLDVVSTVPTHLDANTAAQRRHRFLYRLGIALWNGMTPSEQAVYSAAAVGHPYSGMNLWLREWLTTTPSLYFCLPLEQGSGPRFSDLSPSAWPGTLYGPTWQPYNSGYLISADGIDDYAVTDFAHALRLNLDTWTILLLARINTLANNRVIMDKGVFSGSDWQLLLWGNGSMYYRSYTGAVLSSSWSDVGSIVAGQWALWGINCDLPDITFRKNSEDVTDGQAAHNQPTAARPFTLLAKSITHTNNGHLDLAWLVAFSRALTQAEHESIVHTFAPELIP